MTRACIVSLWLGSLAWAQTSATPATPDPDAASILAHILAQKGTISAAELASVQAAEAQDRIQILAGILREKGILDTNDLARLSLSPANTSQIPQVQTAAQIPLVGPSSANPTPNAPTTVAPSSPNAPPATTQVGAERVETSSSKRVPLTIYGTILFNAGFNTRAMNLNDAGSIVTKPGSSDTANKPSYFETPRQTRLGVRLDPTEVGNALLTGVFEVDAYSSSAPFGNGINMGLFRLRLAYGRLDWQNFALEIGQDWSIFAPLNPSSLAMYAVAEFNGSGNPWARVPQIRLEAKQTLNSANRLLYQLAISDPDVGDFSSDFTGTRPPGAGELGRMPAIESRLAWGISSNDRDYVIGLSGRYGRGRNIGAINGATVIQPVDSWGAAVDYSLPFSRIFNLTGEAYIGRALGIYDVAAGESVGALGTRGGHGVLSRGGWVQTQFNVNKAWQLNFGYGIDNPSAYDLPVSSRDRNENLFGNFIYKLDANIQLSSEYRRLLTYYEDQAALTGRANQFTFSAAYLF